MQDFQVCLDIPHSISSSPLDTEEGPAVDHRGAWGLKAPELQWEAEGISEEVEGWVQHIGAQAYLKKSYRDDRANVFLVEANNMARDKWPRKVWRAQTRRQEKPCHWECGVALGEVSQSGGALSALRGVQD